MAAASCNRIRAVYAERFSSRHQVTSNRPEEMKNSPLFQLFTTYLLASTCKSFSLISSFRREHKFSNHQSLLYESPFETDSEEVFNENDNSLSGEPKWFNPASQNEILSDIRQSELIDIGVVLRTLPIYLLNDEQCFPTG